jgi:hypothetical protein
MREISILELMLLRSEPCFAYFYCGEWRQRLIATGCRKTYVGDGQVIVKNGRILCFDGEAFYSVRTLIRDNEEVFFWSYDIVSKQP